MLDKSKLFRNNPPMALGIENEKKDDDLGFMDQLLSSATKATGATEAKATPKPSVTEENNPDLQAMDQLIQSAQKGVPEVGDAKPPTIGETLSQTGFKNVNEELANIAKEETDPEEIKKFPQWFEKTPEQINYLYEHRKNQSFSDASEKAIESTIASTPGMVGGFLSGLGEIVTDFGAVNPANMTAAPGGEEKAIRALKAFPESVANTFEGFWRQGKNLVENGQTTADQALIALGLKTEEEAKEGFRNREYFNTHNAQYDEENPDVAARAIDASSPVAQKALLAMISQLSAQPDQILAEHPEWSREQAVQYKKEKDEFLAKDFIDKSIAYQNKTAPTENELFATGMFVPAGNEFSMAMKAFEGAGKVIKLGAKIAKPLTPEAEAAANAAEEAKQGAAFAGKAEAKAEKGAVEKYATIVADSISKGGQKLEDALENIPAFYRPYVRQYLPLASLELGAAGVGALASPEDRLGGILKGMTLASTLYAPRVVADLAKAKRTLAGAPGDMFSTAIAAPEASVATKALSYIPSRKIPFVNESVINWTSNNLKDFIRTGAEMVPLGIALGIYNDQDAQEMGETLANGALFSYTHGGINRALGKNPYEAQRYRKQKDYENYKLLQRLPETDRANLNAAASWDEVIADSKRKLDEAQVRAAEITKKDPESDEAKAALKDVTTQNGIYEMNQRASVPTRQEYTRQVLGVLSSADRRINGPLAPGRNFNLRIMTTDQIAQKLMDVNPGMDKAMADFYARNSGARYAASGQVKLPSGDAVGPKAQSLIFDPMRDTAVLNVDKLREVQEATGRPLAWVATHEADHIAQGFTEYRKLTQPLRDKLFGKVVYTPEGKIVPGTEGAYTNEMLGDMFLNNYLSKRTPEQKVEFAKNNDLWDYQTKTYDPVKVAKYMQNEILAEANSAGLGANQIGGKGMQRLNSPVQNIIDWAMVNHENNRLAAVIRKGAYLGVKDPFVSNLTGASFTPEMLAEVRRNNIALNEFNGVLTPHDGSDVAPEITPKDIKNNRALAEEFAKDDGKFKTTKVAEVVDADGNVVYSHLIANPEAAEGEWKGSDDGENTPVRVKGYGQMPEELTTQIIPTGGSMRIVSQIVYDAEGKPVERNKDSYKGLMQARSQLIRDSILKFDQDNPEAMRPFTPDGMSFRGKLTEKQLNEILSLPENIVPYSIKNKLALARDIINRGDGTPTIGMYMSRLTAAGTYKPFSPKIVQSKPISLSFSKDGHFLVNEFNITGAKDKANLILKYQPELLKMWNYDPNEFVKGLSKYMENWQNDPAEMDALSEQAAQIRHRNLDTDFNKAMQMRYVYDAFLNVKPPQTEARPKNFNPVVISLPKVPKSKMSKEEKADAKSSDPMSLIRSRRLDAYSHYEQSNGQKYPFEYGKSIFNAVPEAQISPEMTQEGMPTQMGEESALKVSSPILRGANAIQGKDVGIMGSAFTPSGEKQPMGAQFTPNAGGQLAANLAESGTSLESFGKKTLDELAEYYGVKVPEGASRGEVIDAINGRNAEKAPVVETPTGAQFTPDYAILDQQYKEAVKNKDTARAQEIVDEVAKTSGYTRRVYHGSPSDYIDIPKGSSDVAAHVAVSKSNAKKYTEYGGTLHQWYLKDDARIFDPRKKEDLDALGDISYLGYEKSDIKNLNYLDFEIPEFQAELKKAGFDGYLDKEEGGKFGPAIAVFYPNLLKSAAAITTTLGYNSRTIPPSKRFNVKSDNVNFFPDYAQTYPTSETGFYSQLQKTIGEKMPNKASVQQIMAIVDPAKGSGVKPDEIKWSNLDGFLEGKDSVTKQEVLDYLKNEGAIKFEEKYLAVEKNKTEEEIINEYTPEYIREQLQNWREVEMAPNDSFDNELENPKADKKQLLKLAKDYADSLDMTLGEFFDTTDAQNTPNARPTAIGDPKYSQWVTPNGENYREVVMTMPQDVNLEQITQRLYPNRKYSELDILQRNKVNTQAREKSPEYTSRHFSDIPNYVAHMRLNERSDADGKGLLIEELQSDRHQEARKKGYKGNLPKPITDAEFTEGVTLAERKKETGLTPEEESRYAELLQKSKDTRTEENAIADAPFRKDWNIQLFKRALRDAVDSGKDWIGWTGGEAQAERYNLSKKVKDLYATPKQDGTYDLSYTPEGGRTGISRPLAENVSQDKLADYVGKELAEKIAQQDSSRVYSGPDLKIGGEGMKGFYDEMLPKEVGKYIKKFGANVEKSQIVTGKAYNDPLFDIPQKEQDRIYNQVENEFIEKGIDPEDPNVDRDEYMEAFQDRQLELANKWVKLFGGKQVKYPIWKIKITPEMRETIKTGGQAQFMPKASTPPPSATAATQTLENVKLLTNSFNAGDGGILKNIKLITSDEKKKLPLQELMINR